MIVSTLSKEDIIGKTIRNVYYKKIENPYGRKDNHVLVELENAIFMNLYEVRLPDPKNCIKLKKLVYDKCYEKLDLSNNKKEAINGRIKSLIYFEVLDTEFGILLDNGNVLSVGISEYATFLDITSLSNSDLESVSELYLCS